MHCRGRFVGAVGLGLGQDGSSGWREKGGLYPNLITCTNLQVGVVVGVGLGSVVGDGSQMHEARRRVF